MVACTIIWTPLNLLLFYLDDSDKMIDNRKFSEKLNQKFFKRGQIKLLNGVYL